MRADENAGPLEAQGIFSLLMTISHVKGLFLGYCEGTKAYQLICLETKKIIKSLDVVFFEKKNTFGGLAKWEH